VTPRAAGVVFLLAAVAAIAVTATAFAAHGGPRLSTRIGGLVPARHVGKEAPCNPCGPGKLTYHGGSVMVTNKTYTVFWLPSGQYMQSGYQSTVNQYFTDVAHDSGMPTNVYAASTQYTQNGNTNVQYASTFAGTATDTSAFPINGCTPSGGETVCLSDAQLQAELKKVIGQQGWQISNTNMFFIFTPRNVGSCSQGSCTFTTYCAYHGTATPANGQFIYANMPYSVTTLPQYTGSCNPGQFPNSNDADATINVTSHEHNEAITDPQLNAWYDGGGYENGDKCAWYFGSVSGPNGAEYNQTINGHHYYLQLEFSNDTGSNGGCVQTHPIVGGGGGGPTITSFSPTSGQVGQAVDIQGTNFTGATSVKFNGTPDPSYVVNSSSDISAHVPTGATSGFITVTTPSGTGTSSTQFVVSSANGPTVSSFQPTSGPVGTNVSITGTGFTGATAVTFNGTQAVNFTVNSDTSINANVPGGASTGPIAVTTLIGTGQSSTNFTVTTVSPGPTITGFTPTQGFQGTVVTITGTNFTGATSVKLGTTVATFQVMSSTTIKAITPNPHFLGSYRWSVTTPSGTATSTSFFRFL
jgi:hypothetical protein